MTEPRADGLDIVALGEPMVEFNQARTASADHFLRGVGGDTSNMVIAAARLGRELTPPLRVGYVTRVGDDTFGRQLLALWRSEGVDITGVETDAEAATGVYFVTHGERGHEFSYLRTGSAAARMRPAGLPESLIRRARVLHISGISQAISESACDTVFAAVDLARESATCISFDPNVRLKLWPLARARAIITATIARSDIFLPNLDEARMLSGCDAPEATIAWAHALGARLIALKCGGDGVMVSDGHRTERIAAHQVSVVDATGAGDCFDGAFNVRLLAGDDPFAAARYANAAAALATCGYGAVAPLPHDGAVRALLDPGA